MAWFKKTRKPMAAPAKEKASRVPEGLWVKCPGCAQVDLQQGPRDQLQRLPEMRRTTSG